MDVVVGGDPGTEGAGTANLMDDSDAVAAGGGGCDGVVIDLGAGGGHDADLSLTEPSRGSGYVALDGVVTNDGGVAALVLDAYAVVVGDGVGVIHGADVVGIGPEAFTDVVVDPVCWRR